jgi:hypothetical protein
VLIPFNSVDLLPWGPRYRIAAPVWILSEHMEPVEVL